MIILSWPTYLLFGNERAEHDERQLTRKKREVAYIILIFKKQGKNVLGITNS